MDCTCPYAEGGESCKHMAAVLYAIEGMDLIEEESAPVTDRKDLEPAISALGAEDARQLLLELAGKSQDAKEFILLRLTKKLPADSLQQWRQSLARLEARYCASSA